MRVGIVIALEAEARTLGQQQGVFLGTDRFQFEISGPGPRRAAASAAQLHAAGCDALLSFGLAGGLAPSLPAGALVLANVVHTADGVSLPCDSALQARIAARLASCNALSAAIYSADAAIVTRAEKLALHQSRAVAAVDMESAAVARFAHAQHVPFAALRCVVDPADFSLPHAALVGMAEDGHSRPLATAMALLARPRELPDLIRLALWYGGALRALRAAGAVLCC